jgi:hypothetical protein
MRKHCCAKAGLRWVGCTRSHSAPRFASVAVDTAGNAHLADVESHIRRLPARSDLPVKLWFRACRVVRSRYLTFVG